MRICNLTGTSIAGSDWVAKILRMVKLSREVVRSEDWNSEEYKHLKDW